jgi:flagellar hook-length control protein FliK
MMPAISKGRLSVAKVGLASGVAACAVLAASLAPAWAAPSAAEPTPTATTTAPAKPAANVHARLTTLLQREKKTLAGEQKRLDVANTLSGKVQDRIDTLRGKSRETSQLESALAGFKSAVASAQGSYNSAKSILDAHVGFDTNGVVTDAAQARNTLKTARNTMRQFHKTMKPARTDLRKGVRDYRVAHKPA